MPFKYDFYSSVSQRIIDGLIAGAAFFLAYQLRFEADVPAVNALQQQVNVTPLSHWGSDYQAPEMPIVQHKKYQGELAFWEEVGDLMLREPAPTNTFYIGFEGFPLFVIGINIIFINQSCIFIIYRYAYP